MDPSGIKRVPDDISLLLSEAFLEDNYIEVDPKAAFKAVRHFEKSVTNQN
jgi:hypothetical protein